MQPVLNKKLSLLGKDGLAFLLLYTCCLGFFNPER
jgi:hypothetical protein